MINLFGEDVNPDELIEKEKKGRKRYIPMQEQHGLKEGFKCKNCRHFIRCFHNGKTYFKCELWYISSSEATDIRANATACGKYEDES